MKNDNGIQMEFIDMQAIYVQLIEYVRFPSNALAGHSLRGISFVLPVHPLTAFVYIEKESLEIRGK